MITKLKITVALEGLVDCFPVGRRFAAVDQASCLSAAAQREDHAVLPLPKSLKINKGAASSVLKSLLKRGLIAERPAARDDEVWQDVEDGQKIALIATDLGLQAIDADPRPDAKAKPPASQPREGSAKRKPAGSKASRRPTKPAARAGTKLALLIDLLGRKGGTTIDEAAKATGWQRHSVRGAISGALKKKLGLAIESEAIDSRDRVYRIATRG